MWKLVVIQFFVIVIGSINTFIVPSDSEPACPGINCYSANKVVDPDTCACICKENMLCLDFIHPPTLWPFGQYAVPASRYGCPENHWNRRYINISIPTKDIYWTSTGITYKINRGGYTYQVTESKHMHILGPYSSTSFQFNFCILNDTTFESDWPEGRYCVYKVENECPRDFRESHITLKDLKIQTGGFSNTIDKNGQVGISFCCKNENVTKGPRPFPNFSPFVLIKDPSDPFCSRIDMMNSTEDTIYFPKRTVYLNSTVPPPIILTHSHVGLTFCYYQPYIFSEVPNDFEKDKDLLVSEGRPVYAAPYEESSTNTPASVVAKVSSGVVFYTLESYRPWIQIDLQQFVHVLYVNTHDSQGLQIMMEKLYAVYVSRDQWEFINNGAETCFFGLTYRIFKCHRMVRGQYVTLVIEDDKPGQFDVIHAVEVYGISRGHGRQLGMINGDIKDFQIETSSNNKEISNCRALHGNIGWCSKETDFQPWITIDLILPTEVQGLIMYTGYQSEKATIRQFIVKYGHHLDNLSDYRREDGQNMIFNFEDSKDAYSFQKFWFWTILITRYVKIIVTDPIYSRSCLKLELVGRPINARRSFNCQDYNVIDFGFSSDRHMTTVNDPIVRQKCENETNSLSECQKKTITKGFLGNVYNSATNICCFFNISRENRHFKHLWETTPDNSSIVSERLCLHDDFFKPGPQFAEGIFLLPGTKTMLFSPMFPSNYPKGIKTKIHIDTWLGFYIKINVLYASFSETATESHIKQSGINYINPSHCKDSLTFDVGSRNNITMSRENQNIYRYASFISTNHTATLELISCFHYMSTDNIMYQLEIETVEHPGCGIDGSVYAECTLQTAYIASYLYPSPYVTSYSNNWKITVQINQYIELYIFDLDEETTLESVFEVFDIKLDGTRSGSIGRFAKVNMPRNGIKSSWHMMEIELKIENNYDFDNGKKRGFFGRYEAKKSTLNDYFLDECSSCWHRFQNSNYSVRTDSQGMNQNQVDKLCQVDGGHLVSIGSKEEQEFVTSILLQEITKSPTSELKNKAFVGLHKIYKERQYTDYEWTNREAMTYSAWYDGLSGEYSQKIGYDCVAIIVDSVHNLNNWHRVSCNYGDIPLYVCEKDLDQQKEDSSNVIWKLSEAVHKKPQYLNPNVFICDNGEIVSAFVICDSYIDCLDASDEKSCPTKDDCNMFQFRCDDGKCIHWTNYCDFVPHCEDKSDEKNCNLKGKCSSSEWQCKNNKCIPMDQRCDGIRQCDSDELQCDQCPATTFQCIEGDCIPKHKVCDGIIDCFLSLKDEASCDKAHNITSCEEWWRIGARKDGKYMVNFGSQASFEVFCQFEPKQENTKISTIIYYTDVGTFRHAISHQEESGKSFFFPDQTKDIVMSQDHNCKQEIQMTCYFQDSLGRSRAGNFEQVYIDACKGRCGCLGGVNWTEADVNTPITDNIIITNPYLIPVNSYQMGAETFSSESYYDVKIGPVICETEIPRNLTPSYQICNNDVIYNFNDRCIVHKDYVACRDMSHVAKCDYFACPTGYYKCPQSYCIHPELVCDGIRHCQYGNDEQNCDKMECPGLFKCQRSTRCLTTDKVCDGEMNCPMYDDEAGCYTVCPDSCSCSGHVLICQNTDIYLTYESITPDVRNLNFSHSFLSGRNFSIPDYDFLAVLVYHNCSIRFIPPFSFENVTNLLHLDLSGNQIEILYASTFFGLYNLKTLNLTGNTLLRYIEPMTFRSLQLISVLDLSRARLQVIKTHSFIGLNSVLELNLSRNNIHAIEESGFEGLESLHEIDISVNSIELYPKSLFSPLGNLKNLISDSYIFCCLRPASVLQQNCLPEMDEFSSCSDLMRSGILRVCLWIVGICALVGNLFVIAYRMTSQKHLLRKAHGLFIMNLSISDLLMGIYLIIIAIADMYFKGDYILYDVQWRRSAYCRVAGVLAMMSSEASVSFIMLITLECYLTILFPFGNRRITIRMAKLYCLICWGVVVFLALFPILYTKYFSNEYYSSTAVCLALPFSRSKLPGWEYSATILIFYNLFAFCVIVFCQSRIYNAAKSKNRVMASRTDQDIALARKLFLVILSDFLCWFPVGILGVLALGGHIFPLEVYSWVAVFVMPVNAALNPLLYTFSGLLNKKSDLVLAVTTKVAFSTKKGMRRQEDTRKELSIAALFLSQRDEVSAKYLTLGESLNKKKMKLRECFFVVSEVTNALVYLHHKGFAIDGEINADSLLVYTNKKATVQLKIVCTLKEIRSKQETSANVEDLGKVIKTMLRYTNQSSNNECVNIHNTVL